MGIVKADTHSCLMLLSAYHWNLRYSGLLSIAIIKGLLPTIEMKWLNMQA